MDKKKYNLEATNKVIRLDVESTRWFSIFEGVNEKGERKRVFVLKVEDIKEEENKGV